jgi:hypothetical protein
VVLGYGKIHCKWYLELATTLVQLASITSIKLVVNNTILLDERGFYVKEVVGCGFYVKLWSKSTIQTIHFACFAEY